jgi:hypothetical protein
MKDHEYILNKTINFIKDNLAVVEGKLIGGGLSSMEDYKYHCGLRYAFEAMLSNINEFSKEE